MQGDGSWRISPEHTLRAGFFIQGERSSFNTNSQVLPVDADGMQTSDQPLSIVDSGGKTGWLYSYYLQDEWKIMPKVTINFGARFDQMAQFVDERQLSPRVNVVWQPTDSTTFTAGYARYFMPPPFELIAPTTVALFADTTAAPAVTLNSPAKAERDHYFDVGATQIVLPGLKVGIDAYYKIASNLIDEGQFGAPILLTPFNYQKGLVNGVELTLSYDIENWSFYGNFAAAKALGKNITSAQFNFAPDELAYIADHYIHLDHDQTYTSSAGIKYRLPATNTRFAVDLIAGSGLRADSTGVRTAPACPVISRSISASSSRSRPASTRGSSCASTSSTCSIRSTDPQRHRGRRRRPAIRPAPHDPRRHDPALLARSTLAARHRNKPQRPVVNDPADVPFGHQPVHECRHHRQEGAAAAARRLGVELGGDHRQALAARGRRAGRRAITRRGLPRRVRRPS